MSISSQHPILPTSTSYVPSNANHFTKQRHNLCVSTRLQTSNGFSIPITHPLVFPLFANGSTSSLCVLLPPFYCHVHSFELGTRHKPFAAFVRWITTFKIAFCFIVSGSRSFIQRPFGKITTFTFTLAFTELARPSSIRLSKQEWYLELRLSWLYIKSGFYPGM
jgi:hypothetical protein